MQTQIRTDGMSRMKQDMLGSIFGNLVAQQQDSKTKSIDSRLRSGDIVEMRLWRKRRDSKVCEMEVRHNKKEWVQYYKEIPVPVVPCANLYSSGDTITFW